MESLSKNLINEKVKKSSNYALFPIKYHRLWEFYEVQRDAIWTIGELDFSTDRDNFNKLDINIQNHVKKILAFFSQADGIVLENLVENFQQETSEFKEIKASYHVQSFMEMTHWETYSKQIETLITNEEEKEKLFNAIKNYKSIEGIAKFMFKWMNNQIPFLNRVIAFICVEGILFTSAFVTPYWIRKNPDTALDGFCLSNEWIARDEALHTGLGIAIYHHYTSVIKRYEILDQKIVFQIIDEAVQTCIEFTEEALEVELIGLSFNDVVKYVKCCADSILEELGYEKLYKEENPFEWMKILLLDNKSNFFEKKVSEYSKLDPNTNWTFDTESDF